MAKDPFEIAMSFVLPHEGGYSNDPNDPGGETKYGISKRAFPNLDIANLTEAQARDIYRQKYWDKLWLGQVPPAVALVVMDTAVNTGLPTASLLLQKAFNALALDQPLQEDGWLGPLTRTALQMLAMRNPTAVRLLARETLVLRAGFYAGLAKQKRFVPDLRGWIVRVDDLRAALARESL
jgi:lysozyme family protein